jgi:hypothetical protein
MSSTSLSLPQELVSVEARVGVRFPEFDHEGAILELAGLWSSWTIGFGTLDAQIKPAISTVAKENHAESVSTFLEFWHNRVQSHHHLAANAAADVTTAAVNAGVAILMFKNAMIVELAELNTYLHDNEKYAWASFLPGVADDGQRHERAIEAVNKAREKLLAQKKKAVDYINGQIGHLAKATKTFNAIIGDIKAEGFRKETTDDGTFWMAPPIGDWEGGIYG